MNRIYKKIVVHGGVFHCDDVMCVALMKEIFPDITVERRCEEKFKEEKGVIVADVGGGKYDHHQIDAVLRDDGRKHAACGLLFEDFWQMLCSDKAFYREFKQKYIIPIEDHDNGYTRNPLSEYIKSMNPNWNSKESLDRAFGEAVELIRTIIRKEVFYYKSLEEARIILHEAAKNMEEGILVLPQYCPWKQEIGEISGARYVVFPSSRNEGYYTVLPVPMREGDNNFRCHFPNQISTGVGGCTFIHPARFLAEFDTLEHVRSSLRAS